MTPSQLVRVENLSFSFQEGSRLRHVLKNVSFTVQAQECVFIVGPSGSGKTTLLKLLGAQRTLQQGAIWIGSHCLSNASPKDLVRIRRDIGFVFQSHHLLNALTACQNVQLPLSFDASVNAKASQRRALALLERVGLLPLAHQHPNHLSGGEQQRVAIARALIRKPKLILADEPTAALDKENGLRALALLQACASEQGTAIILVTHDPRILSHADRCLYLEDGSLTSSRVG